MLLFIFFFFFSSRRRHTRFDCDWSSDVCSSDLASPPRRSTGSTQEAPAMIESQIRALFAEIADGEPACSRADTQLAHRRGRAWLRWRRACVAGTSVLAAAAVAALAVVAGPVR